MMRHAAFNGGFRLGTAMAVGVLAACLSLGPDRATRAASALPPNLDDELACLALNIYWEARSESLEGQQAVAKVTLNRVRSPDFPDTICGVVTQGSERTTGCQFSWQCDGRDDTPRDARAWARANEVARHGLFEDPADPTRGALFYHATYVSPTWVRLMTQVTQIGRHIFYRPRLTG